MSSFIAANSMYNIESEREISDALAQFSPEFVMDTIKFKIQDRFINYQASNPNLPSAWEQYFKQLMNNYPSHQQELADVRVQTYQEILQIIAEHGNFNVMWDNINDIYSTAFYAYDFFIANFNNYLVSFFTNFIIREKNGIYESLHLAERKRSKDSSTIYNKKFEGNVKLAIINANLDYVIDNITNFDIGFQTILENIYGNNEITKLLVNTFLPVTDFYQDNYVPVIMSNLRPIIITNIRMAIQQTMSHSDIDITI